MVYKLSIKLHIVYVCQWCGVPQGPVLGPLSFLLYVNDIQNAFTNVTPKLFADDINNFLFHKHLKALYSQVNRALEPLNPT